MKRCVVMVLVFVLASVLPAGVSGQGGCRDRGWLTFTAWAVNQAQAEEEGLAPREGVCWRFASAPGVLATIRVVGIEVQTPDGPYDPLPVPAVELIYGIDRVSYYAVEVDDVTGALISDFEIGSDEVHTLVISDAGGGSGGYRLTVTLFTPPVLVAPIIVPPDTTCRGTANDPLNLRQGPSTDYPIIAELPASAGMVLYGYNGSWYYVETDWGDGWVNAAYVTVTGNCDLGYVNPPPLPNNPPNAPAALPDVRFVRCTSRVFADTRTVTLTCTVENRGNADSGSFPVIAYGPGDEWGGSESSITLEGGAERAVTLTVTYGEGVRAGTHRLTVELLPSEDADFGDNVYTLSVSVPAAPAPPAATAGTPDLLIRSVTTQMDGDARQVAVNAVIGNQGDDAARDLLLYVPELPEGWTQTGATLDALDAGGEETLTLLVYPPEGAWGEAQRIVIEIRSASPETITSNNTRAVAFTLPALTTRGGSSAPSGGLPFDIGLELPDFPWWAWAGGVVVVLAGALLMRPKPASKWKPWQAQAVDARQKDLPLPCQHCTRRVYRSKPEAQLNLYHVTAFEATARATQHPRKQPLKQTFKGKSTQRFNREMAACYVSGEFLREQWDKVHARMMNAADVLLDDVGDWLRRHADYDEVDIRATIEGSSIEFTFTLYHCVKHGGAPAAWEEEATWKDSLKDERDEHVALLRPLLRPLLRDGGSDERAGLARALVALLKAI